MGVVYMSLKSTQDWSSKNKAEEFVDILTSQDDFLLPTKYDVREPARLDFDPASITEFVDMWTSDAMWPRLERRKPFPLSLTAQWWYKEHQQFNELDAIVDERYFKKQENIDKLLTCAKLLYTWGAITHGYICHEDEWEAKNKFAALTRVASGKSVWTGGLRLEDGLPGIYWANFFGPIYVQFFSRERFLDAPAYYKEELLDGGFLLLTAPSPLHVDQQEVQALEQALIDHLGRDAFFEKAHPQKRCRIPQFTFDQVAYGQAIEVQSYDALQDVIPDARSFIKEAPSLAEALVQRLRGRLDFSADSLRQLDNFILRKSKSIAEPWKDRKHHSLIREVVAYYGEVLRRHLLGTWVTVKRDDELLYPAISYKVGGEDGLENPFARVTKLWIERNRVDGLAVHYDLLRSGEWKRLEQHLEKLR